jgi:hypothetical protein
VGFARRAVRKSVRRATPRPVRQAMHPARTVRNAVTPPPVKQVSRAAYTARHPVGVAENAVIGAALYPARRRRRHGRWALAGVIIGLILFIVSPWLALSVMVLAIVLPIVTWLIARRHHLRPGIPPCPAPPVDALHWPPTPAAPPVPPPAWQPPVQQPRVEPWPARQAFRTPPSSVTPSQPQQTSKPSSAGQWELDARRCTGLGDGSRSE